MSLFKSSSSVVQTAGVESLYDYVTLLFYSERFQSPHSHLEWIDTQQYFNVQLLTVNLNKYIYLPDHPCLLNQTICTYIALRSNIKAVI